MTDCEFQIMGEWKITSERGFQSYTRRSWRLGTLQCLTEMGVKSNENSLSGFQVDNGHEC